LKEFCVEPDDEIKSILRYLSLLHEKEELETYVSFGKTDAETRVEVSSINLMWKQGKRLLTTHGDVIFCDSMWNISKNGYYCLSVVVVDEHYDIRLAALSFTNKERTVSWKSFFEWIKSIVPSFKPKCIVTDGASYIHTAFNQVIRSKTVNIVCWWHQKMNVSKKKRY